MKILSKGMGLSETIEVSIINNYVLKYQFSDKETNLDNALVHGIYIHSANLSKTISGKQILPFNEINKGFISLVDNVNKDYNSSMPMAMFFRNIVLMKPRKFNIRNSYINLPQIQQYGGLPPSGMSVVITFFYMRYNPALHTLNGIGELEADNF